MAAAYVALTATQEDIDNAAAGWVFTVDTPPSAGNRLILIVNNEDVICPGPVTDSAGNTWAKVLDLNETGGGHHSNIWTAHLTGVPTSITITKSAAGDRPTVAACIEMSGLDTSNASVVDVTATSSGTGTSCSTGTTAATSQADAIAVAFWDNNNGLGFSGQTNSFTEVADLGTTGGGAGTPRVCIAYKVLSATGTQECTATRAAGGGTNWSSAMVVLKGASGGGAPAPRMLGSLGVGT